MLAGIAVANPKFYLFKGNVARQFAEVFFTITSKVQPHEVPSTEAHSRKISQLKIDYDQMIHL